MRRAWTTLAAVGFTNLQMAMALSMVFVVFPDLEDSFPDSSSATLSWAVNIFTIVGAATLVIGASLARRWGARQALLAGTGLFTLASVAAAVSPNVELLVLCRVVQALGSSLIIPSGAAIVYREFPLHKRGIAVTTWAAIGAVGAAAGPSLGGLLIDVGSWRWAFWLNLPLGIVALAVVAVVIGDTPADRSVRMPDAASSVLLTVGIGAAVLALVQTPEWGWSDARTHRVTGGGAGVVGRRRAPVVSSSATAARALAVSRCALRRRQHRAARLLGELLRFPVDECVVPHRRVGLLDPPRRSWEGESGRRKIRTTIIDRGATAASDLVARDFNPIAPDRLWCGDITYLRTGEGWLFLATVIDLFSRRVIGWSLAGHMRTELVADALTTAAATRGGDIDGVVFHSDRGSQYTSAEFGALCDQLGVTQSMGATGVCWDNAAAESFFGTLKRELANRRRWATHDDARHDVIRWIEGWFNPRRLHSTIDYRTPIEVEDLYYRRGDGIAA